MLIAALFAVCNIYQKGEIEIIRCSIIDADTIEIPIGRQSNNTEKEAV